MWTKKIVVALDCLALLLAFALVADAKGLWSSPAASVAARRGGAEQSRRRRASRRRRRSHVEERRVEDGVWGGQHVRMNVRADGADAEFDCANGSLGAALRLDAEGRFDVAGTYTPEGHGPARIGHEPPARAARYAGRVEGQTMTLVVKFTDTGESMNPLTLTRGSNGRLWKCR